MRTRVCEGKKHGGDDCEGISKETTKCFGVKPHCPSKNNKILKKK